MGKKKQDLTANHTKYTKNELMIEADHYLHAIQMYSADIEELQADLDAELDAIRDKYAERLNGTLEVKNEIEKALKKYALKNRVDLFGVDGDKVSLSHGIILYTKADKVTIPKDAVEQIEKLGWSEGIVIVKNIDRPVIEGWNDEKLAAIGASKKPKEIISWELVKKAEGGNLKPVKKKE
jgi:hypothetical protein